jgi:hypothetical protein
MIIFIFFFFSFVFYFFCFVFFFGSAACAQVLRLGRRLRRSGTRQPAATRLRHSQTQVLRRRIHRARSLDRRCVALRPEGCRPIPRRGSWCPRDPAHFADRTVAGVAKLGALARLPDAQVRLERRAPRPFPPSSRRGAPALLAGLTLGHARPNLRAGPGSSARSRHPSRLTSRSSPDGAPVRSCRSRPTPTLFPGLLSAC